jgi:hypothetical protein
MKKTLIKLLSALLALSICLPLASCVDRTPPPDIPKLTEDPDSSETGAPASAEPVATPAPDPTAAPRQELNAEEAQIYGIYEAAYEKSARLSDVKTTVGMTADVTALINGRNMAEYSEENTTQTIHNRKSGSTLINCTVSESIANKKEYLWTNNSSTDNVDYYVDKDYVYYKRTDSKDYTIVDRDTEEGMKLMQAAIYDISTFLVTPESSFVDAEMRDGENGVKIISLYHDGRAASIAVDGQFALLAAGLGTEDNDFRYRRVREEYTIDGNGYLCGYAADLECLIDINYSTYAGHCEMTGRMEISIVEPGSVFDLKIPENIYYPPYFVSKEVDEELYALYLAAQKKTDELSDVHYVMYEIKDYEYDLGYKKLTQEERVDAELFASDRNGEGRVIHMSGEYKNGADTAAFDFYMDANYYYAENEPGGGFDRKEITEAFYSEYGRYLDMDRDLTSIYPRDVFRGAVTYDSESGSSGTEKMINAVPRNDVVNLIYDVFISDIIASLEEQFDAKEITYSIGQNDLLYRVGEDGCIVSTGKFIEIRFAWYSNDLQMSLRATYSTFVENVDAGGQVEISIPG